MKTLIALAMLVLLGACAKSSDSSTSNTGTGTVGGVGGVSSTTDTGCNGFYDSTARLAGKLKLHYNSGTFVESQMDVRITQVSSTFESSNYNLQFFRWKSDASGNTSLDSTPLSFTIYYNGSAMTSSMTALSGSTVASLRSSSGVGSSTVDFFQKVTLVVDGVDNSWQVLKVVEYNGSQALLSADPLMPVFAANPNTYAANHPAVLASLHPFYSQKSSAYTDSQWVSYANQNCF